MSITKKKITDLQFDNRNINKGSEFGQSLLEKSLREVGLGRSVLTDKNGILIAGNQTVQKASELGFEDVIEVETDGQTLVVVKRKDLDITTERGVKMKILDNTVQKHNYIEDVTLAEAIVEEYNLEPLSYGLTADGKEKAEDDNAVYTRNIEAPRYEPKGEQPEVPDLFNTEKTEALLKEIESSAVPEDVRIFLRMAAQRHTVFNYEKIADFYAHASPEVQRLMEASALVIVDFNKAIESGFIELTKFIQDQYQEDYDDED